MHPSVVSWSGGKSPISDPGCEAVTRFAYEIQRLHLHRIWRRPRMRNMKRGTGVLSGRVSDRYDVTTSWPGDLSRRGDADEKDLIESVSSDI